MDAGIQGALAILGTITGPSPVLDGLVDQIVTVGLPMVPTLVAAAQSQGQTNADTTARMLLNGVQRASEHVDADRKVAIVKGIATHVCPSPVLPWPIRAFAVKALQTIIQQYFGSAPEARAEAVAAAANAMVHIIQTAHLVELSKHLKVTNDTVAVLNAAAHPYHSAEIKSAAEFFALLSEIDADSVAAVLSPKQKAHTAAVAELVKTATEDNNNASAVAVAQAISVRYDPVALGLPRTASLRVALEKLNCCVLNDLSKDLVAMDASEALDKIMTVYPSFFNLLGGNRHGRGANNANNNNTTAPAATNEEGTGDVAAGDEPTAVPAPSFEDIIKSLTTEQNLSKETVTIFLKAQLRDAVARAADALTAAATNAPQTITADIIKAWIARLQLLSKCGLMAKAVASPSVAANTGAALIELVVGLLSVVAAAYSNGVATADANLALLREVEAYTFRSLGSMVHNAAATAADMTSFHKRIAEGCHVVLKALLPTECIPAPAADADVATATVSGFDMSKTNVPMLEAALMLLLHVTPKPHREAAAAAKQAAKGDDAPAAAAVGEKREREENTTAEEGEEGATAAAPATTGEEETPAEGTATAAAPANNADDANVAEKAAPAVVLIGEAQELVAAVAGGAFLTALVASLRVLNEEISAIEIAKKLKGILGDKAPVEVDVALVEVEGKKKAPAAPAGAEDAAATTTEAATEEAAAPSNGFLSLTGLQYRQRALQNVIAIIRNHFGTRVNVGHASWVVPNARHHQHHDGHHRGGRNNNAPAHGNNNNNAHNDRRGGDFKRHRNEDHGRNNNNNVNANNNTNNRGGNFGHSGNHGGNMNNNNNRQQGRNFNNNNSHQNNNNNNNLNRQHQGGQNNNNNRRGGNNYGRR